MGRTCGEPDEIKKNTHPKNITALFREQARSGFRVLSINYPLAPEFPFPAAVVASTRKRRHNEPNVGDFLDLVSSPTRRAVDVLGNSKIVCGYNHKKTRKKL